MENNDMSVELKWLKSLDRVLKKQPDSIVAIVYAGGRIRMCDKEIYDKHEIDNYGDLSTLECIDIIYSELEPYSESL